MLAQFIQKATTHIPPAPLQTTQPLSAPPTPDWDPAPSVCLWYLVYVAGLQQLSWASYKISSNHNCYSQLSYSHWALSEPTIDSFRTRLFMTKQEKTWAVDSTLDRGWSWAEVKRNTCLSNWTFAMIKSRNPKLLFCHKWVDNYNELFMWRKLCVTKSGIHKLGLMNSRHFSQAISNHIIIS